MSTTPDPITTQLAEALRRAAAENEQFTRRVAYIRGRITERRAQARTLTGHQADVSAAVADGMERAVDPRIRRVN